MEGLQCVKIDKIATENDGLRIGDCEMISPMAFNESKAKLYPMDKRLEEIFARYPEVNTLYSETKFDDPIWVINRWLELLPVDAEKKQAFLASGDCTEIVQYLSELVE